MNKQSIDDFLIVEKKYHLNELEINGVNYWNYVRFSIWNSEIVSQNMRLGEAHQKRKLSVWQCIKIFSGFLESIFSLKNIKKDSDILFLNHERRAKNNNFYECIYTETLSKIYKSTTLEKPYEYKHFKPVKTSHLVYTDYISIDAYLKFTVHKLLKTKKYRNLLLEIEEQTHEALNELSHIYSWNYNKKDIYNKMAEKVFFYQNEYKKFQKIIDKINPKVIVEVVYYAWQNMIINEIAREKGIVTVELQHGTIYKEHIAYQFAKDVSIAQLADRIFMFSDFWKNMVRLPITSDHLISVGYPYFENCKDNFQKIRKTDNRTGVVFISQGTIGKDLSKVAAQVADILESDQYRVIYKLHPSEYSSWKTLYPWLDQTNLEVIDNNEKSLYYYFAICDIQIGVYSTAVFEGIGFGLNTIIYKCAFWDVMKPLIDYGYAELGIDVYDICSKIKSPVNETQTNEIANKLWKPNALENIRNELDSLLTRSNYD